MTMTTSTIRTSVTTNDSTNTTHYLIYTVSTIINNPLKPRTSLQYNYILNKLFCRNSLFCINFPYLVTTNLTIPNEEETDKFMFIFNYIKDNFITNSEGHANILDNFPNSTYNLLSCYNEDNILRHNNSVLRDMGICATQIDKSRVQYTLTLLLEIL